MFCLEKMMTLDHYPDTHDGGVQFVKDIFIGAGGAEIPPRRPGHRDIASSTSSGRHGFLMDFELACLMESGSTSCPTGPNRYTDPSWEKFIKARVYPHHSDVDWQEYIDFCESGGGDEWFIEEEVMSPLAQSPPDTRCSGCGRGDDFCRCGTDGIWWGR